MFQEEEFEGHAALTEQKQSFYRASDFAGGSHKPTKDERREHKFFLIGMPILTALVLSGLYNYKQFQDNKKLTADNERLLHSSHNPFVHARK